MKAIYQTVITLFLLIAVISCKKEDTSTKKIEVISQDKSQENNQQGQLAAKLAGNYVTDTYLSEIEKLKSIYKAEDYTTSMLGFELNKDSLAGKHPCLNGYSYNEGGLNASLLYNKTKNRFENNVNLNKELLPFFKSPFKINSLSETQLEIDFENRAKKEVYRKVTDIDTELRRILFEGNYIDKATSTSVNFSQNGKITGIANKHFFELLYSFEGIDFDIVFLSSDDQHKYDEMFHFKIEGNTLKIFKVNQDEESGNTIGALIYELVKQ